MSTIEIISTILVAVFTATAAVIDSRTRRLPNWLTGPAVLLGLAFHTATGGLSSLGLSLAGMATGFGILFVLWLIGGSGGGDVKLMAAVGAWVGSTPILIVFFLSALVAGFAGTFVLGVRTVERGWHRVRPVFDPMNKKIRRPTVEKKSRRRLLPYAVPVAVSTWLVLAWQVLLESSAR